jgi:hypothetical protein
MVGRMLIMTTRMRFLIVILAVIAALDLYWTGRTLTGALQAIWIVIAAALVVGPLVVLWRQSPPLPRVVVSFLPAFVVSTLAWFLLHRD